MCSHCGKKRASINLARGRRGTDGENSKQKLEAKPFCGLTTHTHTQRNSNSNTLSKYFRYLPHREVGKKLENMCWQQSSIRRHNFWHVKWTSWRINYNRTTTHQQRPMETRKCFPLSYSSSPSLSLSHSPCGSQGNMSNGGNWKINLTTTEMTENAERISLWDLLKCDSLPCPPLPASGTLAASVSTATSVETLVMNSRSITQSIETVSSVNQSVKTARWQTFPLTNRSCENTCAISQTEFQRKCFDFDNTSLWFSVYFKHPVKGGTLYVAVVVMA